MIRSEALGSSEPQTIAPRTVRSLAPLASAQAAVAAGPLRRRRAPWTAARSPAQHLQVAHDIRREVGEEPQGRPGELQSLGLPAADGVVRAHRAQHLLGPSAHERLGRAGAEWQHLVVQEVRAVFVDVL